MIRDALRKFFNAYGEILFLRIYPSQVKEYGVFPKILLYLLAVALFYAPIVYKTVTLSIIEFNNVTYALFLVAMHIISRFIRANSQRVQQRFAAIRTNRAFFRRAYLVVEYVLFMWIVYLLYPISCILFPASMLLTFYESLFGFRFFIELITTHTEQYILYGSIVSYILFIFFDNYKRVFKGSLPGYLSLYAVFTVLSGFINGLLNMYMPDGIKQHIDTFSSFLSEIFSLSSQALSYVSSGIVFISAICSLYVTCGLERNELERTEPEQAESCPKEPDPPNNMPGVSA